MAICTRGSFYGRSPQLIDCGFRLYRGCGFHPLRLFRNMVSQRTAHAQIVWSGIVDVKVKKRSAFTNENISVFVWMGQLATLSFNINTRCIFSQRLS